MNCKTMRFFADTFDSLGMTVSEGLRMTEAKV